MANQKKLDRWAEKLLDTGKRMGLSKKKMGFSALAELPQIQENED